ncbi:MAG: hypothetical protein C0599_13815 [Salinivirgaceae bacterium]|nr:MAG: hypothetical protein C0599_13815 [Salinivirgaceae bacterium]
MKNYIIITLFILFLSLFSFGQRESEFNSRNGSFKNGPFGKKGGGTKDPGGGNGYGIGNGQGGGGGVGTGGGAGVPISNGFYLLSAGLFFYSLIRKQTISKEE